MEGIFSFKLRARLAETIFGKINSSVKGDVLTVYIESKGFVWQYTVDHIQDRLYAGLSSEYLAYEIKNAFRKALIHEFVDGRMRSEKKGMGLV